MSSLRTVGISTALFRRLESFARDRGLSVTQVIEPLLRSGLAARPDIAQPVQDSGATPERQRRSPAPRRRRRKELRAAVKRTLADHHAELRARMQLDDPYAVAVRRVEGNYGPTSTTAPRWPSACRP